MANLDNPRGLTPISGNNEGGPRSGQYLANTTTDIFEGDVVQLLANGRVKTVTTTTGNGAVLGVAANYVDASASASPQNVWVYDDPMQVFEVQDDGASATPSQALVGSTFPLVLTTGNTTTGRSKHELDVSQSGQAATDALILLGYNISVDKSIGKNASMRVQLNRHIWKTGSAGI